MVVHTLGIDFKNVAKTPIDMMHQSHGVAKRYWNATEKTICARLVSIKTWQPIIRWCFAVYQIEVVDGGRVVVRLRFRIRKSQFFSGHPGKKVPVESA